MDKIDYKVDCKKEVDVQKMQMILTIVLAIIYAFMSLLMAAIISDSMASITNYDNVYNVGNNLWIK